MLYSVGMSLSANALHLLYRSTMEAIQDWRLRVRQGFNVDDANDFARCTTKSSGERKGIGGGVSARSALPRRLPLLILMQFL